MPLTDTQRWRIKAALEMGDVEAADTETTAYARLLHDLRQPWAEWRLAVARMSRALLIGDLAEAERASDEAGRLGPTLATRQHALVHVRERHLLLMEQGRA